ncbi:hypothetical protein M422DRAFT_260643 [Sphaerobolus stellatus SS14]|uniref:Uncharacterized protein n=1 Tax=Sphaerobolus stellatus (strain SS14) TaxID=990650 RepID=A0A0C9UQL8_SPHS4|nr:hypothetical protein M422DRAFT_260643 [Sphaerobolus stellatus SS14]
MALVIKVALGLRLGRVFGIQRNLSSDKWITVFLTVLPYIISFAFAAAGLGLGLNSFSDSNLMEPVIIHTKFYCAFNKPQSFLQATYGTTLALLIITKFIDTFVFVALCKHWWSFKKHSLDSIFLPIFIIRVLLFSFYRMAITIAYGSLIVLHFTPIRSDNNQILPSRIPVWIDMLDAGYVGLSQGMFSKEAAS